MPLQEETEMFSTFITPIDVYEYNTFPFDRKNSPAWLQKMINSVLKTRWGIFCTIYIDDILVYSRSVEECSEQLEKVLEPLVTQS